MDCTHIVTVFCQGNGASRAQAAKYAGPQGLNLLTSEGYVERVFIRDAPPLLHNLFVYPELSDVGHGFSCNPLHWITHLVQLFVLWYFGVQGASAHHTHPTEMNVGGDQDVAEYLIGVRDAIRVHPQKRIVLFGCSRGAATVLVAVNRLTVEERRHIALVVTEGPFDTVPHVAHCIARVDGWFPDPLATWRTEWMLRLLSRFAKYRPEQESPLQAVQTWPLDTPLAVVRSRVDDVVPEECTLPLLARLRERSHPHLHELILQKSGHTNMSCGDAADRASYLEFMRGLYERYAK